MLLILLLILSINYFDFLASIAVFFSQHDPYFESGPASPLLSPPSPPRSNILGHSDCLEIVKSNKLSWSKPMTLIYRTLIVLIKGNEKPFITSGFDEKIKIHRRAC